MAKCKYNPDTFPLLAEGWAREGLTEAQIAKNLRVSVTTLGDYKKKHPLFYEALKRGQAPVDIEVENALLKRALGYDAVDYTEEDKVVNGKVVRLKKTVVRHIPAEILAIIYWLKNRKPAHWRDRPESGGSAEGIDDKLKEYNDIIRKRDTSK